MTDFLGRELKVGDKVVALAHRRTSSTLYLGEVEKLTNKMVVIKTVDSEYDWRYEKTMCVSSYKVVKIDTKAEPTGTIPMDDKHSVELTMRPICECGYVFNELRYNTLSHRFAPYVCPKCMRNIDTLSCIDISNLTSDGNGDICICE